MKTTTANGNNTTGNCLPACLPVNIDFNVPDAKQTREKQRDRGERVKKSGGDTKCYDFLFRFFSFFAFDDDNVNVDNDASSFSLWNILVGSI